jgi:hypothetical protein
VQSTHQKSFVKKKKTHQKSKNIIFNLKLSFFGFLNHRLAYPNKKFFKEKSAWSQSFEHKFWSHIKEKNN